MRRRQLRASSATIALYLGYLLTNEQGAPGEIEHSPAPLVAQEDALELAPRIFKKK